MTKKGISPLIATVLIIGFVIVLGALVMQWGTGMFESIKKDTGVKSEVNLICSSGLSQLEVTRAVYDEANQLVKITIDNRNDQKIAGFLFRGHYEDGSVETVTKDDEVDALGPFAVETYELDVSDAGNLKGLKDGDKIGVMAIITTETDGSKHTCSNEITRTIEAEETA